MHRTLTLLSLVVAGVTANGQARDVVSIAGKEISKQEKFEVIFEDKLAGHMISFTQVRTTTRETKGDGLFDFVNKTCSSTWDLTNGTGSVEGFCSCEKEGDRYGVKWNGMCNSADGNRKKPLLRCGGGWAFVTGSGTGSFVGITGGGTWAGSFLSSGDFEEEWIGIYRK